MCMFLTSRSQNFSHLHISFIFNHRWFILQTSLPHVIFFETKKLKFFLVELKITWFFAPKFLFFIVAVDTSGRWERTKGRRELILVQWVDDMSWRFTFFMELITYSCFCRSISRRWVHMQYRGGGSCAQNSVCFVDCKEQSVYCTNVLVCGGWEVEDDERAGSMLGNEHKRVLTLNSVFRSTVFCLLLRFRLFLNTEKAYRGICATTGKF